MVNRLPRTARVLAVATVMGLVMMMGVPSAMTHTPSVVGVVSADGIDVDREFVVGIDDMTLNTLNPNVVMTVDEYMAVFPCYSALLQYDEDSQVIGDLARSWSSSSDGLTWEFDLYDSAYFCDPSDPLDASHQVTAEDVVFTYAAVTNNPSSILHHYIPDVVRSIEATGAFSVEVELFSPFAAVRDAFIEIPILPQYIWESEDLTDFDNSPPIGSGPFYYATDGLPPDGIVVLKKNPLWHMTAERGWSPRVDTWVLKRTSLLTGLPELKLGDVDLLTEVQSNVFISDIPAIPDVVGFAQSGGFVYEFNLNQMTDERRVEFGGAFKSGTNNQLLLDPTVKHAFAMSIDKTEFVDEVIVGLGTPADSLLPEASPWHYAYPDPVEFDTAGAREMLMDAGWAFDVNGAPASGSTVPLCREGGADPLSFRFFTLNTAYEWATGALEIRDWCEESGIQLVVELRSAAEMNTAWYSADYDVWLWDWMFDPLGDPSTSALEVLTTDAIGYYSDVFCSIPEYDALYNQSLTEMDPVARRAIINEMQVIAYEDMACQCVAYRMDLYAASTQTWINLGDLGSKYMMRPEVSNLWLSMEMYPVDNNAPDLLSLPDEAQAEAGVPMTLSAYAVDDDVSTELVYRWFWGDGTSTDWSTSGTASHAYEKWGVYTADVAVMEATASNGFEDHFVTSGKVTVTVHDTSNAAPTDLTISYVPVDPDTATNILFMGSAVDPEGDPITFSWDFGDGETAVGSEVEHQYAVNGVYTVTLYATDGVIGATERPVSMSVLVLISPNSPPIIVVPDFEPVLKGVSAEFVVEASDPDSRDTLQFTWDWGDGSTTVTYVPYATHTYELRGFFTVTVTVSDMTGLPGHVVSDTGVVYVGTGVKTHYAGG